MGRWGDREIGSDNLIIGEPMFVVIPAEAGIHSFLKGSVYGGCFLL